MLRNHEELLRDSGALFYELLATCILEGDIKGDMRENVVREKDNGKREQDKISRISCIDTIFMV